MRRLLDTVRLPTPVVLVVWGYAIWRCIKSGYVQDAFGLAVTYVRPIKF